MTSANGFVPRSLVSPFGQELENILEDHGLSWQIIEEMLALEVRDLSALLSIATGSLNVAEVQYTRVRFPSAGSCRCSCPAASRCVFFSATSGSDSQEVDSESSRYPLISTICIPTICIPSQPQSTFTSSCNLRGIQVRPDLQLPDSLQLSPLLDRTSHNCCQPPRQVPFLRSAWTLHGKVSQKSVISWSQFTMSLARPHRWLGFESSRSASPCGVSSASNVFRSLRTRSSRAFPLMYWQVALRALPTCTSQISHSPWKSRPSCIGSSAWFLS